MRKRRRSLILVVVFLLVGQVHAYTITFNIGANVSPVLMDYVVLVETISEGETYVVPEVALTGVAAAFQAYWDAFEGTTMAIPEGALNEDIVVLIRVSNFDLEKGGGFLDLDGEKIFLYLDFAVEGWDGGPFSFNEGYPMEFALPLDAEMLPLLGLAGFDPSTPLTLAYWITDIQTGLGAFESIHTTRTAEKLVGELPQLSAVVGKKGTPTALRSSRWGMIKALLR